MGPPPRPDWVEALNQMGRSLGSPASLVSLDAEELLASARAMTGLDDFGDDAWREPFALLLDGMERDADLHLIGRLLAREDVLRSLTNRLLLADAFAGEPSISREAIRAPVVVTGMGRSGTTILHELLAQDPAHRSPATWELLYPCPPPETATYRTDARIGRADADWTLWARIAPEYQTMHDNRGDAPNECILGTMPEFRSDTWSGNHHVPAYLDWLVRSDMGVAYRFHRRLLQLLQWRCPGERWVLKAPSHLGSLPSLFATYPDARVVIIHRDPMKVLPSLMSLMATLLYLRSDEWRHAELTARLSWAYPMLFDHVTALRDGGSLPAPQIHDVRYHDLMTDPVETLAALYRWLELDFTPAHEARARAHLAARPKDRHRAHAYSFDQLDLDADDVRASFAGYLARYDIPSEV